MTDYEARHLSCTACSQLATCIRRRPSAPDKLIPCCDDHCEHEQTESSVCFLVIPHAGVVPEEPPDENGEDVMAEAIYIEAVAPTLRDLAQKDLAAAADMAMRATTAFFQRRAHAHKIEEAGTEKPS